jgi:hypothetical protein
MQDFRQLLSKFFSLPEWCFQINNEESWVECENKMDCQYSHTLVDILFNILHIKMRECPHRTSADKFGC